MGQYESIDETKEELERDGMRIGNKNSLGCLYRETAKNIRLQPFPGQ
jgi:hypothetical protein